jgi:methyltransferase-like protein
VSEALSQLAVDRLLREQYRDYLLGRMFRQTLVCHAEVALNLQMQPERLAGFHIASCAQCARPPADIHSNCPEEFRAPNQVPVTTSHSISKAAMVYLAEVWPRSVGFTELQAAARARLVGDAVVIQEPAAYAHDTRLLAENLLKAYRGDVVELHAYAPPMVTAPSEQPRALAFARYQARHDSWVTNASHQLVKLDPLTRQLLRLLDGQHDRAALVEELTRAALDKTIVLERYGRPLADADRLRAILRRELDTNLAGLAKCALLVA